ncbi:hypothetical protein DVH24_029784 [Malus domestica]|uniref:Uncharacterized protein n=1 Tax=Malus domestica TaxID=3750 RepID=A0A498I1R0_MALDO|nr:hypothetical protein DVH24_029784 [Malus domestica]
MFWNGVTAGSRCRGGKMRRAELLGGAVIAAVAATLLLFGNGVVVEASASSSSSAAFVQNTIYSNKIAIFSKSYCPPQSSSSEWPASDSS